MGIVEDDDGTQIVFKGGRVQVRLPDTDAAVLGLIRDVYDTVVDTTESLEPDHLGEDLAYLLGAIAKGGECEWPADRPLVQLLDERLPPEHPVFGYIVIEKEEEE